MYRIMYITPADTHTSGIYPSGWGERAKGGEEDIYERKSYSKGYFY